MHDYDIMNELTMTMIMKYIYLGKKTAHYITDQNIDNL